MVFQLLKQNDNGKYVKDNTRYDLEMVVADVIFTKGKIKYCTGTEADAKNYFGLSVYTEPVKKTTSKVKVQEEQEQVSENE